MFIEDGKINDGRIRLQVLEQHKDQLITEVLNDSEISDNKGFEILLKQIEYMKAMLFLMKGDTLTAFNYFLKIPFGMLKLKLFISFLLPLKIIKRLRT